MISLLLVVIGLLGAADRTVCASGCDYTSAQSAIDASSPGDSITLTAGETFGVVAITRNSRLLIRSSRWAELPPAGTRVDKTTHAALLATIQTTDTTNIVQVGTSPQTFVQNGVSTTNDTIDIDYVPAGSRIVEGDAIVCQTRGAPGTSYTLPTPLVEGPRVGDGGAGKVYYARDVTDIGGGNWRIKVSLSKGGTAIDLTATGGGAGAAQYYDRPVCSIRDQPNGITFQGIKFVGSGVAVGWVQVGGGVITDPLQFGPSGINFDRVVISNAATQNGPGQCLALWGGSRITVSDSVIDNCKWFGNESKAVSINGVDGVDIRNNYLSGASIILLVAGNASAMKAINKNIRIAGNYFERPGYMMYSEGAGAPSGACYYGGGSGAYYRNTTPSPNTCANSACYTCQANNTWAVDTDPLGGYRSSHYLVKNFLEFKDCGTCTVEGNVFVGGTTSPDSGQGFSYGVSSIIGGGNSDYHINKDVIFKDNWTNYGWGGVFLGEAAYDSLTHPETPLQRILFDNNLFSNMGLYPMLSAYTSEDSGGQRANIKGGTYLDGLMMRHNTFRGNKTLGAMIWSDVPLGTQFGQALFVDNLLMGGDNYGFVPDGKSHSCTASGGILDWFSSGGKYFRHNSWRTGESGGSPWIAGATCQSTITDADVGVAAEETVGYVSASNHRLSASSPYSASNGSATLLATDGSDLGADVDKVMMSALPAIAGTTPVQLKWTIGSTLAVVQIPANSTCTVEIFTDVARVTRHSDASSAQSCTRSGSTTTGSTVSYLVGGSSALTAETAYTYKITSGTTVWVGQIRTNASAGGAVSARKQYATARTGNVCANAAMDSGCSAIPSSTTHTISGTSPRYYQGAGGPVEIVVDR